MNHGAFLSEDNINSKIGYKQLFSRMGPYFLRHKLLFILCIFSVILTVAVERGNTFAIGYLIDQGIRPKNLEATYWAIYLFITLSVVSLFLGFIHLYLFQYLGNRVLYYVREDLISHLQKLPMNYYNKTPTGRIVTRSTNDVSNLGDLFSNGVIEVFIQFIVIVGIIISMSLISIKLTIVCVGIAPFFMYLSFQLSEKIRLILHKSKKQLAKINSFVAENLAGIKVVQLYNRVNKNREIFRSHSNVYRDINLESIKYYALMQPIMNLFNGFTIGLAIYLGGFVTQESALSIGAFVTFFLNIQDFIHPLRDILEKYQQFQNSLTSAERVFQMMDENIEQENSNAQAIQNTKGQIEIKNLNFKYSENLPLVLKNINLVINPGESVALVGRTGSGKSTFISLLQRFYDAPQNTIFLDQKPIENILRNSIRHHVGVVQQDNFIFKGTIANNVSLNDPSIDRIKILSSLEQVGYLKLLNQTGRNIDSAVEERGSNLSVGERQLIAFARILAFNPSIFILDEATANIDSESEKLIQEATKKITNDRTSIIIAHRLSTVRHCDKIIVLQQGEIAEVGNHSDLMNLKGIYHHFVSAGLKSMDMEASADGTAVP